MSNVGSLERFSTAVEGPDDATTGMGSSSSSASTGVGASAAETTTPARGTRGSVVDMGRDRFYTAQSMSPVNLPAEPADEPPSAESAVESGFGSEQQMHMTSIGKDAGGDVASPAPTSPITDAGFSTPLPTRTVSGSSSGNGANGNGSSWDAFIRAGIDSAVSSSHNLLPRQSSEFVPWARNVATAATRRASGMAKFYANIDLFRPYFNVDTKTVFKRLTFSLLIRKNSELVSSPDLYTPLMLCFTLVALVTMSQKSSRHQAAYEYRQHHAEQQDEVLAALEEQNTVLGTSILMIFGFWLGVSAVFYLSSLCTGTRLRLVHYLSIIGYSMFGHVITLTVGHMLPVLYYVVFPIFTGGSALSMAWTLYQRTPHQRKGIAVAVCAGLVHFMYAWRLKYYSQNPYAINNAWKELSIHDAAADPFQNIRQINPGRYDGI